MEERGNADTLVSASPSGIIICISMSVVGRACFLSLVRNRSKEKEGAAGGGGTGGGGKKVEGGGGKRGEGGGVQRKNKQQQSYWA